MNWISPSLEHLAGQPIGGYIPEQSAASEPTALTALALAGSSLHEPAKTAARWLAEMQSEEGSVSVRPDVPKPRWPTALAVIAWQVVADTPNPFQQHIQKALDWSLALFGAKMKPNANVGHHTMLSAWPWVEGTHSWIEPTAFQVLALKASAMGSHPRAREAVRLLIDRQLPDGGCNYGNKVVLGQTLRPHVQPTGIALLALAGEEDTDGAIERSFVYLERKLSKETTIPSLCWGLMGLAAHDRRPTDADQWLRTAVARTQHRRLAPIEDALLVLASLGEQCPLLTSASPSIAST